MLFSVFFQQSEKYVTTASVAVEHLEDRLRPQHLRRAKLEP